MPFDGTLYENKVLLSLINARERIKDPENWIQGDYAKDVNNNPVYPTSPEAVKFCAKGALMVDGADQECHIALEHAHISLGLDTFTSCMVDLNDKGSHRMIMDVYSRAIKLNEDK